jgi:RsiW-degrading membrane proteinase PrsW (M82 family)
LNNVAVCCVCDRPIEGQVYTLGGRTYDALHYERVSRENRAAIGPLLVTIAAGVLFAGVLAALFHFSDIEVSGIGLIGAGVVLALVPAAIWLFAFYQQDRLEPEPKKLVLGVFILGALLAAAVGQPLIRDVFRVQEWSGNSLLTGLISSILIVGFIQEFLKYAAVRYTVFGSSEFDERVDGIIYGAAAGLGYATLLNLQYVIGNEGVDLGVGAMRVVTSALAQASFAGITGYFIARAKFEKMGPFWLPLGVTLAAVLNGVVSYALGEVTTLFGFSFNPWYGLVVAVIVAGATFVVLFGIIRRLNSAATGGATTTGAPAAQA